jgi:hypothetical protein
VRLRFVAVASAGCMELGVVRLPVKKTEIIGTVRAQKRRSRQSGTLICCRAWHVNLERGVLAGTVAEMFSRCPLFRGLQKTQKWPLVRFVFGYWVGSAQQLKRIHGPR